MALAPVLAQHLWQQFYPAGFPPSVPQPQPRHPAPACRDMLCSRAQGAGDVGPRGVWDEVSAIGWLGLFSCARVVQSPSAKVCGAHE